MKGYKSAALIDGRWYSTEVSEDEVIETVVDVETLEALNLLVGEYIYWYPAPQGELSDIPVKLRVVRSSNPDEYLNHPEWIYAPPLIIPSSSTRGLLKELAGKRNLTDANWDWNWIFDRNRSECISCRNWPVPGQAGDQCGSDHARSAAVELSQRILVFQ